MDSREKLLSLPESHYRGDLCDACGTDIRYKKDDRCVSCEQYRRPKDTANGKALFTERRRRVEDLELDYYDSLLLE